MIRAHRNPYAKLRLEDAIPASAHASHAHPRARKLRKFIHRLRQRRRLLMFFAVILPLAGLVAASALGAYLQPRFLINVLAKAYPEAVFTTETSEKIIALTIDDAPTRGDTPQILDLLQEHNATATFFCIGYNMKFEDKDKSIMHRIRDEGHEMGNHMSYDTASYQLDDSEFTKQLLEVDEILEEITRDSPPAEIKWFRPGHGFFTQKMINEVAKYGYTMALGDVYPHDPMITLPSVNSYYVLNRVHPGAIVVLHNRPWTIKTLRTILPKLKEMGYTITTLSELMKHDKTDRKARLAIKND